MSETCELTHLDIRGLPRMVDMSTKLKTAREAEAEAVLWVGQQVMLAIRDGRTPKGKILETSHIAWVIVAKRTPNLIPLCRPLNLTHASVDIGSGTYFV